MGRMFGPAKGMSSTTLPYKRRAPSWIKLKPEDLSEQFYKLARKGITPSSIGVTFGDSFGVAQLKMFTSIKFLRFLKKKGLAPFIPEDLYFLVEKDVSMQLSIEEPVEPPTARSTVSAPQKLCFGSASGSWCGNGLTLSRDSRSSPLVGTLYFKQDWILAHLRPCTCWLSSSQWKSICRTTSPCPGTSRCPPLFPPRVAPQFRVGHLDPSVSRVADKLYSASETPRMVSALHQSCDWLLQNLTPGERPVLERLRPCTAPGQFLLERAILCETCLSQCLGARRVG